VLIIINSFILEAVLEYWANIMIGGSKVLLQKLQLNTTDAAAIVVA
jgi:hypothetical protein